MRTRKLDEQRAEDASNRPPQPQVLRNVKAYINGYLEGTTDLEMKRIITQHGGTVL